MHLSTIGLRRAALTTIATTAVVGATFTPSSAETEGATLAVEGTIQAVVSDTFGDHGSSSRSYVLRTDDGDVMPIDDAYGASVASGSHFDGELVVTDQVADEADVSVRPGATIEAGSATGEAIADAVTEVGDPVDVASGSVSAPRRAAALATSTHRVYVAIVDGNGDPGTTAAVNAKVDAMGAYWETESGGTVDFVRSDTVRYNSAKDGTASTGCNITSPDAIWDEAIAKVKVVDPTSGTVQSDHLIVVMPSVCGDRGVAGIGTFSEVPGMGNGGLVIATLGDGETHIGAHEIGHNLGLGHANMEHCTTATTCQAAGYEYEDIYSVMGFAVNNYQPPALGSLFRKRLGLTTSGEVPLVSVTGTSSRQIAARSATSGVRGLEVVDPTSGIHYFVDYRNGAGRDSSAGYGKSLSGSPTFGRGVVVSRPDTRGENFEGDSLMQTLTGSSPIKTFWGQGSTFASRSGDLQVRNVSTDGSTATVDVTVGVDVLTPGSVTMSGAIKVGSTVEAATSGWPSDTSFTYQWYMNSAKISGATGSKHAIPAADNGKWLSVWVTGSKPGFRSVTVKTASTKIAPGTLVAPTPTISGWPKVARTLTANPGAWPSGVTKSYAWFANGVYISGGSKQTLTLTKAHAGKNVKVKVTGSKAGYTSASAVSAATYRVLP